MPAARCHRPSGLPWHASQHLPDGRECPAERWGESGDAGFNVLNFWAIRGPGGGTIAATSFWLNDDPSDHGGETGRTMLLDASGHVIASAPHYLPISGVIDLDGDGVSEIVTYAGVIRWNGSRWVFPVPVMEGCD